MDKLKVGLVQMKVIDDKEANLSRAEEMIKKAVGQGAKLIILPEMFNCPYEAAKFPVYAEEVGGPTWQKLSIIAREIGVFLIGGSIPELDGDRIYNTSYIFDDQGRLIAKHRKMHLFDVDIKGGQTFKESDTLSAGDKVTVFETPSGKIGVAICYDIRFPELARLMVQKGTDIIVVPGAFNMTTGPAHWELLFRTRALDNQVFTIGVAPARNPESSYISYGNSIVVDPWGRVINRLGGEEGILVEELNLNLIERVRQELPLLKHRRLDLYKVVSNKG